MSEIKIEKNSFIDATKELRRISEEVNMIYRNINGVTNTLRAGWRGGAGQTFQESGKMNIMELKEIKKETIELANDVKATSSSFENTDIKISNSIKM